MSNEESFMVARRFAAELAEMDGITIEFAANVTVALYSVPFPVEEPEGGPIQDTFENGVQFATDMLIAFFDWKFGEAFEEERVFVEDKGTWR